MMCMKCWTPPQCLAEMTPLRSTKKHENFVTVRYTGTSSARSQMICHCGRCLSVPVPVSCFCTWHGGRTKVYGRYNVSCAPAWGLVMFETTHLVCLQLFASCLKKLQTTEQLLTEVSNSETPTPAQHFFTV